MWVRTLCLAGRPDVLAAHQAEQGWRDREAPQATPLKPLLMPLRMQRSFYKLLISLSFLRSKAFRFRFLVNVGFSGHA